MEKPLPDTLKNIDSKITLPKCETVANQILKKESNQNEQNFKISLNNLQ